MSLLISARGILCLSPDGYTISKMFSRLLHHRVLSVTVIVFFSAIILAGCNIPFRKKVVSGLQITTDGVPAAVFLNGAKVGSTPYSDQELEPGSYTVRIEPEDSELAEYETSVMLYPSTLAVMNWNLGKTTETSGGVVYELEPIKKKKESNLSIASIPDGAIVKVDDESQGFTPVLMKELTPGTHRFQVSLPSYKEEAKSVNIAEGFQMNVTVKLAKENIAVAEDEVVVASDEASASVSAEVATLSPTPTPKGTKKTSPTPTPKSSSSKTSAATAGQTVLIKETGTGWLRVRETPSSGGKELAKVDVGETFAFFEKQDGWYQIEYEKGEKGWVSAKYVSEQ